MKKFTIVLMLFASIQLSAQEKRIDQYKPHPVKIWRALLTQQGTNQPYVSSIIAATQQNGEFENTLGGEIIWTRFTEGQYIGILNGAFPFGQTLILFDGSAGVMGRVVMRRNNNNSISIFTFDSSGELSDDMLNNNSFQILVYW